MTTDIDPQARGQRHAAFVYICPCGHHLTVFKFTAPSARQSDQLAERRGWTLKGELWRCANCSAE